MIGTIVACRVRGRDGQVGEHELHVGPGQGSVQGELNHALKMVEIKEGA